MKHRLLLPSPFLLALFLGGCTEEHGQTTTYAVRDSAEVRIVENGGDLGPPRPLGEPALVIGAEDGPPEAQFGRVVGALRLSTGEIAVADAMADEIRLFGADGVHRRTFGGRGSGPGESRDLARLFRTQGDTLVAVDRMGLKVSVFTHHGQAVRTVPLRPNGEFQIPDVLGVFPDGSLLVTELSTVFAQSETPTRTTKPLVRYDANGEMREQIAQVPGEETVTLVTEAAGGMAQRLPVPYGANTHVVVHGDSVYVADSERYRVDRLRGTGRPETSVRRVAAAMPVTEGDMEAFRSWRADALPPHLRAAAQAMVAKVPRRPGRSAHAGIAVASTGDVWVARAWEYEGQGIWDVFDANGRFQGSVQAPVALQITDVGETYLLGTVRDSQGVQSVHLYDLAASGEGRQP